MRIDKWLVIQGRKGRYNSITTSTRLVEREPTLQGNEIAVRLVIEVPDEFFKRPILRAELSIPDTAVPKVNITTEVTDNVEKIIKETTGLEMRVSLVPVVDEQEN